MTFQKKSNATAPAQHEFYQQFDKSYYTEAAYDTYLKEHVEVAETEVIKPLLDVIKPDPSWTFLDVGCGMGGAIIALRARGFEAQGTEISPYCLEEAPAKKFMTFGEAFALPFPDKSFDVIVCCGIFAHLTIPQAKQTIAEFNRVARKYVSLIVFGGVDSPAWDREGNPDQLRIDETRTLTQDDYKNFFTENGATLEKFIFNPYYDYEFTPEWHFIFRMPQ